MSGKNTTSLERYKGRAKDNNGQVATVAAACKASHTIGLVALYGIVWQCVALCGIVWWRMWFSPVSPLSNACISCAPPPSSRSHRTTHSSSPSASIYSWFPPGGSHQQGRTGGPSQRINNPSARRINNPVAVARIINPAHYGRGQCRKSSPDNPLDNPCRWKKTAEPFHHSNCAGEDRCRTLL